MDLVYVKKVRGLDFVEVGMKVQFTYDGKFGKIKGGNNQGNLDVIFEGDKRPCNCHPTYMMRYFDNNNNIIAEYGE